MSLDWDIWVHYSDLPLCEAVALALNRDPKTLQVLQGSQWADFGRFLDLRGETEEFKGLLKVALTWLGKKIEITKADKDKHFTRVDLVSFCRWLPSVRTDVPAQLAQLATTSLINSGADPSAIVEATKKARTGLPGRPPESGPLIEEEFLRRISTREPIMSTLKAQADELIEWLTHSHLECAVPKSKSVQNLIRTSYNSTAKSKNSLAAIKGTK